MKYPSTSKSFFDKRTALIVCGAAVAQLGLTALGLPGWICPFRAAFGLPCPGCGITRATLALLSGDVRTALHLHAFAAVAILAVAALAGFALLPAPRREHVADLARRSHLAWPILAALIGYWIYRLSLDISPAIPQ